MLNILLVRPKYWECHDAPLGLAVLAAVARRLDHSVTVCDLNVQKLPSNSYDIVGITGMSAWKKGIKEVAQKFPEETVIVGGPWATSCSNEALADENVDFVCVGEGEKVWQNFLTDPLQSRGLLTAPIIENLDMLPFPAWDLVPHLTKYVRVPLWTSRGCPYHCCFCDAHQLFTRKWRARKPKFVIEEIEWLYRKFAVRRFTFADDNPTLIPERFMQICKGIIENKIEATFDFDAGLRVDRLPSELLETMKQAGFKRIQINPESGCQRVLDEVIHKSLDLKFLMPVVHKCLEIGLDVDCYFVIGFPWETKREIQETLGVVHKLRSLGCNTYVGNAIPLLGTELYEQAKAQGFLRFDGEELAEVLSYVGKKRQVHALTSSYWTPEYIMQICHDEYRMDMQSSIKRYAFTKRGITKLLKNPVESLKMLRKTL